MDSVTQFALGAGVSCALLGRRIGLRKAALTGGLLGTLPDLDVFIPPENAIDAFISHRGWSHSLIVHAAVTPFLGEAIYRLFGREGDSRIRFYAAVFLCLTTHALLDAMTIYGTRLFWPIWDEPVGVGSVFIIDPLYTLPLVVVTLWALIQSQWNRAFGRGIAIALVASTGYLGWTMIGQSIAAYRSTGFLAGMGIEPTRTLTTPTPFNSLYWRTVAIRNGEYFNVYVPLLGGDDAVTAYRHDREVADIACWMNHVLEDEPAINALARFSKGFFKVYEDGRTIRYADLRMGITPNYAFTFNLAMRDRGTAHLIEPEQVELDRSGGNDWDWLEAGILGKGITRDVEAAQMLDHAMTLAVQDVSTTEHCS